MITKLLHAIRYPSTSQYLAFVGLVRLLHFKSAASTTSDE